MPLLSLAIAYALKGARSPQAFAIAVVPLAALPFSPEFRANWLPSERAFRPFAALFTWGVLGIAFLPPLYPHLDRLALLASYLLFASAAVLWNERERRAFLLLVVLLGSLESIVFLVQYLRDGALNGHLFGNPIYSGLAVAGALLAIPVLAGDRRNGVLLPIAILLAVVLALGRSRSALIGLLVAAAFMAPRRRYLAGLGVLAAAALVLGIVDHERVLDYLKIDLTRPENIYGRLTIWKSALAAAVDRPLTGWGLGNFEAGYLRHQVPIETPLRFARSTPFAHNDYLQLAVEAGWIGLSIGIWLLVEFFRGVRGKMGDKDIRWACSTVVLYSVAALFSFTFFLPFNGFVAAAAFGIGARTGGRKPAAGRWIHRPGWLVIPAFLVCFSIPDGISEYFSVRDNPARGAKVLPIRGDLWYDAGIRTLSRRSEDPEAAARTALEQFRSAIRWNKEDPFAWNRLGMVAMALPDAGTDPASAFARAIDLAPSHAPFWIDAGFERMRARDGKAAIRFFMRAAELEPNAPMAWFALAVASKEAGDRETMGACLEKAMAARREFINVVAPSGYSSYLFGMSEEQMRAALK